MDAEHNFSRKCDVFTLLLISAYTTLLLKYTRVLVNKQLEVGKDSWEGPQLEKTAVINAGAYTVSIDRMTVYGLEAGKIAFF